MRDVLVTGAAGFIGGHVSLRCVAAGWRVTALDERLPTREVVESTAFRRADTGDPAILQDVRDGRFHAVLHHAAITDTLMQDWPRLERTNVSAALDLAEACAAGSSIFIYASSHSVYGRATRWVPIPEDAGASLCSGPLNLYAKSKLMLDERMAARTGPDLHWMGIRYTNVFGAGEHHKGRMASIISQVLRMAARGERVALFADTMRACRDYVPVEVVGETCVGLIDEPVPSGVYNLGSGHPISFARLVEWCSEFSGVPLDVVLVPNPLPERYQYWTCADMTKLRSAMRNPPVTTVEDVRLKAKSLFAAFQAERS